MDFRYFMANYWWVNASIFKIINIIHLMRTAFDFPSKIIILACNKKLNHDRLGFFNDLSRSTPNK